VNWQMCVPCRWISRWREDGHATRVAKTATTSRLTVVSSVTLSTSSPVDGLNLTPYRTYEV
jgi:hypothetical protein